MIEDRSPPPNGHRRAAVRFPEEELQLSARLLLYLAEQPRWGSSDVPPPSATQGGMVEAMGVSQGAVARVLGRLVEGGVLIVEAGHVQHRWRRLKTYRLTGVGEALAERVRRAGPPSPPAPSPPSNESMG